MAAKNQPSPKPAAAATTEKPGSKSTDGQVIKLLVTDNPKRKNTKSFTRFALYKNGMTVAQFIAAGGTRRDISWDVEHEHIELVKKAS